MNAIFKQSYFKFGLLMTASLIICLGLMEITGQNESFENKSPIFLIYQFILPAVIWYLGIKTKKDGQKGKLTFKEGVREGFKISVVFALTSPFIFAAYYLFVNPPILKYVKAAYGLTGSSDHLVIIVDMAAQVFSAIIFGTIYGAIISFFLKSKKK